MINIEFPKFSIETDEGKMLLAALAILTSIDCEDITSGKFGGMTHPQDAFESVMELANKIYYEDEYELYLSSLERDKKIDSLL